MIFSFYESFQGIPDDVHYYIKMLHENLAESAWHNLIMKAIHRF